MVITIVCIAIIIVSGILTLALCVPSSNLDRQRDELYIIEQMQLLNDDELMEVD